MIDQTRSAVEISRRSLEIAEALGKESLGGLRNFLGGSLTWVARQLNDLGRPLEGTAAGTSLRQAAESLEAGASAGTASLSRAMEGLELSFQQIMDRFDQGGQAVQGFLFENVQLSSIVGQSFLGVDVSRIQPSFRLNRKDVTPGEMAAAFLESGRRHLVICVPGLFCDESVWDGFIDQWMALDFFPLHLRLNPGDPIGQNGQALLELMESFLAQESIRSIFPADFNTGLSRGLAFSTPRQRERKMSAIAYSQGSLILRSALYYARSKKSALPAILEKIVLIAAPDGGSYMEKLGFALAAVLSHLPGWPFELAALIGNERSAAMQDLSHGIIRLEDRNQSHTDRRQAQRYFGELDGLSVYHIYGLVSRTDNILTNWIGDGVVEKASLETLSKIYERSGRVYPLSGYNHFQILRARELPEILDSIFLPEAGR